MKRLRDMRDDDPLLEQAQELLSTVEPLAPSQERMQRVRRALDERRAARGVGLLGLLRGPRALGLAVVLVFGVSTLAAAQTGVLRAVIARVSHVIQLAKVPAPHAPAPSARPAPKRATPAAPQLATQADEPSLPALAAPEPVAAETALDQPSAEPKRRGHARPARVHTADAEIVRRAVKALRRDGDAALAGRLLEEAHQKSPDGALAEEVMSLRVEAALTRGDAKARSFAREYLARYPAGRYRAQVERALAP